MNALNCGKVQASSMWLTNADDDQVDRPVAEHLIRG